MGQDEFGPKSALYAASGEYLGRGGGRGRGSKRGIFKSDSGTARAKLTFRQSRKRLEDVGGRYLTSQACHQQQISRTIDTMVA